MIFDEMHYDMGYMMNWFTPDGALILLGVISFIVVVIILLFVLNRRTNHEDYLQDTTDTITPLENKKGFTSSETAKYCSECGSILDDRNSKFCPLCGTNL